MTIQKNYCQCQNIILKTNTLYTNLMCFDFRTQKRVSKGTSQEQHLLRVSNFLVSRDDVFWNSLHLNVTSESKIYWGRKIYM